MSKHITKQVLIISGVIHMPYDFNLWCGASSFVIKRDKMFTFATLSRKSSLNIKESIFVIMINNKKCS